MKKLAIFGAGGLGREVARWAAEIGYQEIVLTVDDECFTDSQIDGFTVFPFSQIVNEDYVWTIAVADSSLREITVNKLGKNIEFATLIHSSAVVQEDCEIGKGVIVAPRAVVSINTKIGKHSIVNSLSIIGHDSAIGEYATISPGALVLGNCTLGVHVFLGANSTVREKTNISNGTIVGMGAVVVTDLSDGVYVGNPARKIE